VDSLLFLLFSGCIQDVFGKIDDYLHYTVITQIEYVNEYPMTLPAVTLCLVYYTSLSYSTNATLKESLLYCSIDVTECDSHDLYETQLILNNNTITCYVLNGGRNSSVLGQQDLSLALTSNFTYQRKTFLFITYLNPITSEINKYFNYGTSNDLVMEKTVETKLEYPFNNCWSRFNLPDTPLVGQLAEANITYRKVNFFELCFQNLFKSMHWITELVRERQEGNYDRITNCNDLCPSECESTQYRISESKFSVFEYS